MFGLNHEINNPSLEDFLQLARSPLALFLKVFNFIMLTTFIKFSTSLLLVGDWFSNRQG
jgi:hypothetical protein